QPGENIHARIYATMGAANMSVDSSGRPGHGMYQAFTYTNSCGTTTPEYDDWNYIYMFHEDYAIKPVIDKHEEWDLSLTKDKNGNGIIDVGDSYTLTGSIINRGAATARNVKLR